MPCSSSTSNARSATSWLTRDSAAAPKITRVLSWPVRPNGRSGIGMRPSMPDSLRVDHFAQAARVVYGRRAALPQGVVVEVAVAVDTLLAPLAEATRPGLELVVFEKVAALAAVEADVG